MVESGVLTLREGATSAQKNEHDSLWLRDLKDKNNLFQATNHAILETILCKDTSKKIWDSIKKKYHGMQGLESNI